MRELKRAIAKAQDPSRRSDRSKPKRYGPKMETASERKRRKRTQARVRVTGLVDAKQQKALRNGGIAMGKRLRNLQRGLWKRGPVHGLEAD